MAQTYRLGGGWCAVPGYGDNGEVAIFNTETKAGFDEHDEWIWQVPEEVLNAFVASRVREERIGSLEQASDDEILGIPSR